VLGLGLSLFSSPQPQRASPISGRKVVGVGRNFAWFAEAKIALGNILSAGLSRVVTDLKIGKRNAAII
jgi:hypothetical protein